MRSACETYPGVCGIGVNRVFSRSFTARSSTSGSAVKPWIMRSPVSSWKMATCVPGCIVRTYESSCERTKACALGGELSASSSSTMDALASCGDFRLGGFRFVQVLGPSAGAAGSFARCSGVGG